MVGGILRGNLWQIYGVVVQAREQPRGAVLQTRGGCATVFAMRSYIGMVQRFGADGASWGWGWRVRRPVTVLGNISRPVP